MVTFRCHDHMRARDPLGHRPLAYCDAAAEVLRESSLRRKLILRAQRHVELTSMKTSKGYICTAKIGSISGLYPMLCFRGLVESE